MKRQLITLLASILVLAAAVGTVWYLTAAKSRAQDRIFQTKFEQLQGYDQDPVLQSFRDGGQKAVMFLARKTKDTDSSTRIKAVSALRSMRSKLTASTEGIAALCGAVSDSDPKVRSIAEGALGDIGAGAKAAVPALIQLVSQGEDINGVWALGRIGPEAKAALPILESKMRQEMGRERVYAAGAVWAIGGQNDEAKAVIKKALNDPDKHVQVDAHNVLVQSPEMNLQQSVTNSSAHASVKV